MKHKTWFRLVIKTIGVLLIGLSISGAVTSVVGILDALFIGERWTMYSPYGAQLSAEFSWPLLASTLLQLLPPGAQLAFGIYLLVGGKWIVNRCIPSNRPYCPECGYDLSNSRGAKCPECGVALPISRARLEGAKEIPP
jgi:hypothetical protein